MFYLLTIIYYNTRGLKGFTGGRGATCVSYKPGGDTLMQDPLVVE